MHQTNATQISFHGQSISCRTFGLKVLKFPSSAHHEIKIGLAINVRAHTSVVLLKLFQRHLKDAQLNIYNTSYMYLFA